MSTYGVLVKALAERGGLRLTQRAMRPLEPHEALIRVHRAAICGTDLHILRWNSWAARSYEPPFALGHELSGEIVDLGTAVAGMRIGDRVAAETHLECGSCTQCEMGRGHTCLNLRTFGGLDQGAFAEYSIVPQQLLRAVPPGVSHKHACLMEPLGIAARAVRDSSVDRGTLLVTGCGPIGLLTIAVARALHVGTIAATDISHARLALARDLGADVVAEAGSSSTHATVLRAARAGGFDAAVDASGSPAAIAGAMALVRPGGYLVVTGMPSEPVPIDVARQTVLREVTLRGIYGRLLGKTWRDVEALVPRLGKALDRIVTHEFPLQQFERAFEVAASGQAGKVEFVLAS